MRSPQSMHEAPFLYARAQLLHALAPIFALCVGVSAAHSHIYTTWWWMLADPYIYQDQRNHWHLLAHVYNTVPFKATGLNYISGHGFSKDGVHWNLTNIEPYRLRHLSNAEILFLHHLELARIHTIYSASFLCTGS